MQVISQKQESTQKKPNVIMFQCHTTTSTDSTETIWVKLKDWVTLESRIKVDDVLTLGEMFTCVKVIYQFGIEPFFLKVIKKCNGVSLLPFTISLGPVLSAVMSCKIPHICWQDKQQQCLALTESYTNRNGSDVS